MIRASMLLLLVACGSRHKLPTATIQVGTQSVLVEVANDREEWTAGLMYRDSLPPDEGMIFVYPVAEAHSFWMKNTRIPLSVAFIDSTGTIVKIADMKPMDTHHTRSGVPVRYALEMNRGWFERNGILKGAKVTGISALGVDSDDP